MSRRLWQWQLAFGGGGGRTDETYQQTDRRSISVLSCNHLIEREEVQVGADPARGKSNSSLPAPRHLHQSSFPESFTWKLLVSTSFTLPDGKHAWVFIWVTLYFSQLQLAALYNFQLSQHRALMNRDCLYSMVFFSLWVWIIQPGSCLQHLSKRTEAPSLIGRISTS